MLSSPHSTEGTWVKLLKRQKRNLRGYLKFKNFSESWELDAYFEMQYFEHYLRKVNIYFIEKFVIAFLSIV